MGSAFSQKSAQDSNMKSQINILLPDLSYSYVRNEAGVRHHLYELYTKVFGGQNVNVFPTRKVNNILYSAIRDFIKIRPGSLNVVTQGYSVLATYAAAMIWKDIRIIVHTWKVPGFSDDKITAYIYDYVLSKLISKSLMVVVASKKQERQMQVLFPSVSTFFAPVTVDTGFWSPKTDSHHLLVKHGLKESAYVLTVGGNDRNEEIGMKVSGLLGIPYVRVTKNQSVIDNVKTVEKKLNMSGMTILLSNISDADLAILYQNAFVVLLPTITETNPAGLSSLVEALSCGAMIAVGSDLAEGYIVDGEHGIVFRSHNVDDIVDRLNCIGETVRETIKGNARDHAVRSLNSDLVAANLQKALYKM